MKKFLIASALALSLGGCATYQALFGGGTSLCSNASQCVYQAKGVFASSLVLANAYAALPTCPQGAPVCKDVATVKAIDSQAHSAKSGLDLADALVNGGLLPNGATPTAAQISEAATQAAALAQGFQTATTSLPHN